jgi:hypothetical protein
MSAVSAMRSQMSGYRFEQVRSRSLGQGNLLSRSGGFAYSYDVVLLTTDCTTIFGLLCAPYG